MELKQPIRELFDQLSTAILKLGNEQYALPSKTLFNATIGQHVRHIIELFLCLDNGYQTGIVNYENRERNPRLETDRVFAVNTLFRIHGSLARKNKVLLLEANYDAQTEDIFPIPTNYYRELLYNLEHTVHHMALIRIGIHELSDIQLPEEFGVAASTLKHKKKCAR